MALLHFIAGYEHSRTVSSLDGALTTSLTSLIQRGIIIHHLVDTPSFCLSSFGACSFSYFYLKSDRYSMCKLDLNTNLWSYNFKLMCIEKLIFRWTNFDKENHLYLVTNICLHYWHSDKCHGGWQGNKNFWHNRWQVWQHILGFNAEIPKCACFKHAQYSILTAACLTAY